MEKLTLQQGESVQLNISLTQPLQEGDVLYFALCSERNILKSGSTKNGSLVDTGDGQNFTFRLSPRDTASLTENTQYIKEQPKYFYSAVADLWLNYNWNQKTNTVNFNLNVL